MFSLLHFPLSFLTFPVNLSLLVLLVVLTFAAHHYAGKTSWWRRWTATSTSLSLIGTAGGFAIAIAFFPQAELQQSWPFALLLFTVLAQLLAVICRYRGAHRLRFLLNHGGLFLFIAALSLGSADSYRLRTALSCGETIEQAYDCHGRLRNLGYSLTLDDFHISEHPNGSPEQYTATVRLNGETYNLQVNHPLAVSWKEDLYVVSCGTAGTRHAYCVIESVTQPWKYLALTGLLTTSLGALLLLWGKKQNRHVG